MSVRPLLHGAIRGERLELTAVGTWTAVHAPEIEPLVNEAIRTRGEIRRVLIDMSGVDGLDTFGAWLIERLARAWSRGGVETRLVGIADHYRGLVEEVHKVNRDPPPPLATTNRFRDALEIVGRAMAGAGRDIVLIVEMLGAVGVAAWRVIAHPTTFRFTSVVHHLDRVGFRAIPIILLITFLIGCIIAQQGLFHFRKFGADIYVVDMVGILVLREIGVLIVAVMVAGRSGSAYTAELGSMKMREEVDALRTMGFDPVEVLILPRVIALVIGLPILAFIGTMAALYGGGIVCWIYGGISPDLFISRLKEAITLDHFEVGMIKAPFMAMVIGVVACNEGLQTQGSAESLGAQTTASVVKAIFLTIVLDGAFAVFFAAIGK